LKKRLFIAIGIPNDIKKKLEEAQNFLKRFARDAKWVRDEGIHLTLKFLGYVDPERLDDIRNSLLPISKDFSPFTIRVKGFGFFPNPRRPAVLWCGVDSRELNTLQSKVEEAMSAIGFEKENRAFSPHLTLCRFRDPHGLLPLANEVSKKAGEEIGEFNAESFTLYESILQRSGAEYIKIAEFTTKTPGTQS
jgi:2'-5' RNA ligase